MSDNAELKAKRQRVAELKARRAARKQKQEAGGGRSGAASKAAERAAERKRKAAERREARLKKKEERANASSAAANTNVLEDVMSSIVADSPPKELTVVSPTDSVINIDSVVPEFDEKGVLCDIIGGTDDEKKAAELAMELENERLQLMEDQEKLEIFKTQLKKDKLRYDKLKEAERLYEPKELTRIEIRRIESSKGFQNFFVPASKIVERALNFTYDFASHLEEKVSEDAKLSGRRLLLDEKRTGKRAITSISWSQKYNELLLSSYDGQDDPTSLDPDGSVLLWNMHMPNRPEHTLFCNSAVLTAEFHPSNPKLIVGGCKSGQVVIWDTRAKKFPMSRTSLSRGHTYPVYALRCLPVVNNNNLVSVSTDGLLCQWNDSSLNEPTNEIDLKKSKENSSDGKSNHYDGEITTNCFDFPGNETSSVILGSDEGKIYKARIYDQKGIWYTIDAHDAPITNVQFHPAQKNSPTNVSDIFLTSSFDWTVKLWSSKTNRALYTFESAKDYVFDAQWSPLHPSIFASGDGSGKLDIWDLNKDTEVPYYSTQVEEDKAAISRLKWSEDGTHLAVGMSSGAVYVYNCAEDLYKATSEDSNKFYSKMASETINV